MEQREYDESNENNSIKELNFTGNDGIKYGVERMGNSDKYAIADEIGTPYGDLEINNGSYELQSNHLREFPEESIKKILIYLNGLITKRAEVAQNAVNGLKETLSNTKEIH